MAMANSSLVNTPLLWISAKSQMLARTGCGSLEVVKKEATSAGFKVPEEDLSKPSKMASNCWRFSGEMIQSEEADVNEDGIRDPPVLD
ncbi:hypothetical protein WICPIJ_004165 [Wickerhamomyces pijperi]|uniref:Uncharacterized protein n=1 Tax=Wickerhamomyces pijperi TaxID=599730 RepID=A0A9P8Q6G2_WICPI|nr:hypothetical protein WICPIJ_004165 [Wickerhamomyces pijperi]